MNTAKLKSFAPAVRRQLLEAVTRKLDFVLSAQTPDFLATYAHQAEALSKLAQLDRTGLIERVAYTWFNRLAALRYLDAKGWHPFRARVLMPATPEETQPELLKLARTHALPEELRRHTQPNRLNELLDGHVPSANPQGEVYRQLVLAACRFYNALLPDLFERLDDETELLLPDDLLTEHSVAHGFRTEITDADCAEVEILGWLYQFYISEKKDAVMARKSAVPTADIPAVTQLFTPHWIVRYLVENSLGRLWLLNHPESRLREQMPYYIEEVVSDQCLVNSEEKEATSPPAINHLSVSSPTEIRLLDPACGSGHMLTYAFDLLYAIYAEAGYPPSEIPGLILTHNLYGLDICPRAAQLAALALVLKAREKSRPFFQPNKFVQPKIMALQDVRFEEEEVGRNKPAPAGVSGNLTGRMPETVAARPYSGLQLNLDLTALANEKIVSMPSVEDILHDLNLFENATTFGSLLQPKLSADQIASLRQRILDQEPLTHGDIFAQQTKEKILLALEQAEMLTQRYHVVVANPPYMGGNQHNPLMKRFVSDNYTESTQDLYGCFIERSQSFILTQGFAGLITIPNWMFTSSFTAFRSALLSEFSISSLIHNGRGVWGSDFGSCAFVLKQGVGGVGRFYRLFTEQGEVNSNEILEQRFISKKTNPDAIISSREFTRIPSSAIVYWSSWHVRNIFYSTSPIGDFIEFKAGMSTGDNQIFQRLWYEVERHNFAIPTSDFDYSKKSKCRWFACNSGGDFRKWYGNNSIIVDWYENGKRIKNFIDSDGRKRSAVRNESYYFIQGITYSKISIGRFAARSRDPGYIFDDTGRCAFILNSSENYSRYLAFLSSIVADHFLKMLTPTVSFTSNELQNIPWPDERIKFESRIESFAVSIARADWDNFETSWDFRDFPLLRKEVVSDQWLVAEEVGSDQGLVVSEEAADPLATSHSPLATQSNHYSLTTNHFPLKAQTLEQSWNNWSAYCQRNIARMQALETENNRLFIEAYGLQDELTPEVPEEQITLARADRRKDMAAFLSYAIGCMMGRYSLDAPGLILADAGSMMDDYYKKVEVGRNKPAPAGVSGKATDRMPETVAERPYSGLHPILNSTALASTFSPDEDGIFPILDGEWFEDDIVARTREFLRTTFDEVGLRDNIRFIEESLGKDLRKYFLTDFYKDHLQTYKKRPIYWLVQSPKKGFSVLIYLHRYTKDTMNRVLNRYLRPYQEKLRNRLAQLAQLQVSESVSTRDKTAARKEADKLGKILQECEEWERKTLLPLAQQRIELDLDDGVKVNYLKLGEALAPIPGLAGKDSD